MCYVGEEMFYVGSHYVDRNFYSGHWGHFLYGSEFFAWVQNIYAWVKHFCVGQTFFAWVKLILYGLNFFSSLGIFFALVWFIVFRLWFTETVNKFN